MRWVRYRPATAASASASTDGRGNIATDDRNAWLVGLAAAERPTLIMPKTFEIGDRVSWNSEAGRVRGKVIKVHRHDVNWHGYIHRASSDDPVYEIKSATTDHIALHKAAILRRLR